MDNKKLMQILLRDAGEIEELIAEIRKSGSYDALDMELLHTRASGIRRLLETAAGKPDGDSSVKVMPEKHEPEIILPEKEKSRMGKSFFRKEKSVKENVPPEPFPELPAEPKPETETSAPVVREHPHGQETTPVAPVIGLDDEQHASGDRQILAEKFVAGKSLNDLLLEKSRTDLKFSSIPVSSLAGAIGTNERFLFTRELFDGNMESFNEAVNKIDLLNNIQEAADFLRENFKWKKSETSLRFIDLVKRRFTR